MLLIIIQKIKQHKEFILYGLFGIFTTAINFATYTVCNHARLATVFCVVIAWFVSVFFAYVFSRAIVFHSTKAITPANVLKEFTAFALCRVTSGAADLIIMLVFADGLGLNHYAVKLVSCGAVTVINYVISKKIFSK